MYELALLQRTLDRANAQAVPALSSEIDFKLSFSSVLDAFAEICEDNAVDDATERRCYQALLRMSSAEEQGTFSWSDTVRIQHLDVFLSPSVSFAVRRRDLEGAPSSSSPSSSSVSAALSKGGYRPSPILPNMATSLSAARGRTVFNHHYNSPAKAELEDSRRGGGGTPGTIYPTSTTLSNTHALQSSPPWSATPFVARKSSGRQADPVLQELHRYESDKASESRISQYVNTDLLSHVVPGTSLSGRHVTGAGGGALKSSMRSSLRSKAAVTALDEASELTLLLNNRGGASPPQSTIAERPYGLAMGGYTDTERGIRGLRDAMSSLTSAVERSKEKQEHTLRVVNLIEGINNPGTMDRGAGLTLRDLDGPTPVASTNPVPTPTLYPPPHLRLQQELFPPTPMGQQLGQGVRFDPVSNLAPLREQAGAAVKDADVDSEVAPVSEAQSIMRVLSISHEELGAAGLRTDRDIPGPDRIFDSVLESTDRAVAAALDVSAPSSILQQSVQVDESKTISSHPAGLPALQPLPASTDSSEARASYTSTMTACVKIIFATQAWLVNGDSGAVAVRGPSEKLDEGEGVEGSSGEEIQIQRANLPKPQRHLLQTLHLLSHLLSLPQPSALSLPLPLPSLALAQGDEKQYEAVLSGWLRHKLLSMTQLRVKAAILRHWQLDAGVSASAVSHYRTKLLRAGLLGLQERAMRRKERRRRLLALDGKDEDGGDWGNGGNGDGRGGGQGGLESDDEGPGTDESGGISTFLSRLQNKSRGGGQSDGANNTSTSSRSSRQAFGASPSLQERRAVANLLGGSVLFSRILSATPTPRHHLRASPTQMLSSRTPWSRSSALRHSRGSIASVALPVDRVDRAWVLGFAGRRFSTLRLLTCHLPVLGDSTLNAAAQDAVCLLFAFRRLHHRLVYLPRAKAASLMPLRGLLRNWKRRFSEEVAGERRGANLAHRIDHFKFHQAFRHLRKAARWAKRDRRESDLQLRSLRQRKCYPTFLQICRMIYYGQDYYKAFFSIKSFYVESIPTAASLALADDHRDFSLARLGLRRWRSRVKLCQQQRQASGPLLDHLYSSSVHHQREQFEDSRVLLVPRLSLAVAEATAHRPALLLALQRLWLHSRSTRLWTSESDCSYSRHARGPGHLLQHAQDRDEDDWSRACWCGNVSSVRILIQTLPLPLPFPVSRRARLALRGPEDHPSASGAVFVSELRPTRSTNRLRLTLLSSVERKTWREASLLRSRVSGIAARLNFTMTSSRGPNSAYKSSLGSSISIPSRRASTSSASSTHLLLALKSPRQYPFSLTIRGVDGSSKETPADAHIRKSAGRSNGKEWSTTGLGNSSTAPLSLLLHCPIPPSVVRGGYVVDVDDPEGETGDPYVTSQMHEGELAMPTLLASGSLLLLAVRKWLRFAVDHRALSSRRKALQALARTRLVSATFSTLKAHFAELRGARLVMQQRNIFRFSKRTRLLQALRSTIKSARMEFTRSRFMALQRRTEMSRLMRLSTHRAWIHLLSTQASHGKSSRRSAHSEFVVTRLSTLADLPRRMQLKRNVTPLEVLQRHSTASSSRVLGFVQHAALEAAIASSDFHACRRIFKTLSSLRLERRRLRTIVRPAIAKVLRARLQRWHRATQTRLAVKMVRLKRCRQTMQSWREYKVFHASRKITRSRFFSHFRCTYLNQVISRPLDKQALRLLKQAWHKWDLDLRRVWDAANTLVQEVSRTATLRRTIRAAQDVCRAVALRRRTILKETFAGFLDFSRSNFLCRRALLVARHANQAKGLKALQAWAHRRSALRDCAIDALTTALLYRGLAAMFTQPGLIAKRRGTTHHQRTSIIDHANAARHGSLISPLDEAMPTAGTADTKSYPSVAVPQRRTFAIPAVLAAPLPSLSQPTPGRNSSLFGLFEALESRASSSTPFAALTNVTTNSSIDARRSIIGASASGTRISGAAAAAVAKRHSVLMGLTRQRQPPPLTFAEHTRRPTASKRADVAAPRKSSVSSGGPVGDFGWKGESALVAASTGLDSDSDSDDDGAEEVTEITPQYRRANVVRPSYITPSTSLQSAVVAGANSSPGASLAQAATRLAAQPHLAPTLAPRARLLTDDQEETNLRRVARGGSQQNLVSQQQAPRIAGQARDRRESERKPEEIALVLADLDAADSDNENDDYDDMRETEISYRSSRLTHNSSAVRRQSDSTSQALAIVDAYGEGDSRASGRGSIERLDRRRSHAYSVLSGSAAPVAARQFQEVDNDSRRSLVRDSRLQLQPQLERRDEPAAGQHSLASTSRPANNTSSNTDGVQAADDSTHSVDLATAKKLFEKIDKNNDGTISLSELVFISRDTNSQEGILLHELLGLPPRVRQEDGTKDMLVHLFSEMHLSNSLPHRRGASGSGDGVTYNGWIDYLTSRHFLTSLQELRRASGADTGSKNSNTESATGAVVGDTTSTSTSTSANANAIPNANANTNKISISSSRGTPVRALPSPIGGMDAVLRLTLADGATHDLRVPLTADDSAINDIAEAFVEKQGLPGGARAVAAVGQMISRKREEAAEQWQREAEPRTPLSSNTNTSTNTKSTYRATDTSTSARSPLPSSPIAACNMSTRSNYHSNSSSGVAAGLLLYNVSERESTKMDMATLRSEAAERRRAILSGSAAMSAASAATATALMVSVEEEKDDEEEGEVKDKTEKKVKDFVLKQGHEQEAQRKQTAEERKEKKEPDRRHSSAGLSKANSGGAVAFLPPLRRHSLFQALRSDSSPAPTRAKAAELAASSVSVSGMARSQAPSASASTSANTNTNTNNSDSTLNPATQAAYEHREEIMLALRLTDSKTRKSQADADAFALTLTQSSAAVLESYALHAYMNTLSVKAHHLLTRWFEIATFRAATCLKLSLSRRRHEREAQKVKSSAACGAWQRFVGWIRANHKRSKQMQKWHHCRQLRLALRIMFVSARKRARRRAQVQRGQFCWTQRRKSLSMLALQAGIIHILGKKRRGGLCRTIARNTRLLNEYVGKSTKGGGDL